MDYNQTDFLRQLNKEVIEKISSGVSLPEVVDSIENRDLYFYAYREYVAVTDNNFPWVDDFKKTVNAIRTIISKPKIHLRTDKVLLNANIASKVDSLGLIMTVKDTKLWKKKDNEFKPEYIYANVYEDELPIYENRFLVLLINKMSVFVSLQLLKLYQKTGALNKFVDKNGVELSDLDAINATAYFYKQDDEFVFDDSLPLLTSTDNKVKEYIEKLNQLRISVNKIKKSSFYKICDKARHLTDTEVHPTNVLTMHPDYRVCYDFYRKLIKYVEQENIEVLTTIHYENYAVLSIIHSLTKAGYKLPQKINLTIENEKIVIKDLKLIKEPVSITLNVKDNLMEIDVDLLYFANKFIKTLNLRQKRGASYAIVIEPNLKYTYFIKEKLNEYIDETINKYLREGFDNCFIINPFESISHPHSIMVSPHSRKLDKNIDNLIKSFAIFIEGDEFIYSRKCPICGSFMVNFNNVNYDCLNCNTVYAIMNTGKKEENRRDMIWIKRITTINNNEKEQN